MKLTIDRPPKHLSWEGKKLWKKIAGDYDLDTSALVILKTALEAFDRLNEARVVISREGTHYTTPNGYIRPHPMLQIEKEARSGLLQAWRALDLSIAVPGRIGRPSG